MSDKEILDKKSENCCSPQPCCGENAPADDQAKINKKNRLACCASYVKNYIDWGAGPRASQNLILGAKAHALINGKYAPDIENVKAIAPGILRHRILKNYKAEAEGISEDDIISELLK